MEPRGKATLKNTANLLLVYSVACTMLSLVVIFGGGVAGVSLGFTNADLDLPRGVVLLSGVFMLLTGILSWGGGYYVIKNAGNASRAKNCLLFGVVMLVAQVAAAVVNVVIDMVFLPNIIIGCVLPLFVVLGAVRTIKDW
jgi:hypothetical protein